jgi:hypothetical protein
MPDRVGIGVYLMTLYRYAGKLLRVAGGLAGAGSCCCDEQGCCAQIAGRTLLAEVVATTGMCDMLLGCQANLTEGAPGLWDGEFNTCGCTAIPLLFRCVNAECPEGEEGYMLSVSGCPGTGVGDDITACGTCLDVEFTFTVSSTDLVCQCCGGFGGGGTYTVRVTLAP